MGAVPGKHTMRCLLNHRGVEVTQRAAIVARSAGNNSRLRGEFFLASTEPRESTNA